MPHIEISRQLREKCPQLRLGCLSTRLKVESDTTALWEYLEPRLAEIQTRFIIEDIRHIPAIAHTRAGYKLTGKDPARYRPSAEALLRRVVSGKGLYRVNNVVDLLNFVSVSYGFSIGGYDEDKIQGNATLGIGETNEPYEAIGRGVLNIAGLPVFRDEQGAFGTPTSDSQRTMVRPETKKFLMAIFSFHPEDPLPEAMELAHTLLKQFADGHKIETTIIE